MIASLSSLFYVERIYRKKKKNILTPNIDAQRQVCYQYDFCIHLDSTFDPTHSNDLENYQQLERMFAKHKSTQNSMHIIFIKPSAFIAVCVPRVPGRCKGITEHKNVHIVHLKVYFLLFSHIKWFGESRQSSLSIRQLAPTIPHCAFCRDACCYCQRARFRMAML